LDIKSWRPKPEPHQRSAIAWFEKHDSRKRLIVSSKLRALKSELFDQTRGEPGDKKIIFVQWLQAAILIGSMLEEENIPFVYYWVSPEVLTLKNVEPHN
jgi:hypothetical protein